MTTASSRDYDDGGASGSKPTFSDELSDVTPTDDRNARGKDCHRVEKTLRFRFAPSNRTEDNIAPGHVHLHWITAVQETFGDQVRIIDNHNRVLPTVNLLRWTTLQHQQHFNIHQPHQVIQSINTTTFDLILPRRVKPNSSFIEFKQVFP